MTKPEDIMRWSLHQVPATKAPKMLERSDGMWVLYEDHAKAILSAVEEEREACARVCEDYEPPAYTDVVNASIDLAAAIRSRKEA